MKLLLVIPLFLAACNGQYIISPWTTTVPLVRSWDPRITWDVSPKVVSDLTLRTTPLIHTPAVVPAVTPISLPTSSQYRVQDELGQFAFGHRGDNQARDEVKSFDGSVRGAYSYVDPTGKLVNVQYLADHNGFRVLGANNLPVAPALPELKGPEPVKDTIEVIEARAAFEKEFLKAGKIEKEEEKKEEKDKKDEEKSRQKRQVLLTSPWDVSPLWTHRTVLTHPLTYSTIPIASPVVPLAKTVVKTAELKPIEDLKTPAATKAAEIKEKEHEIVSPFGLGSLILPGTRTIVLSKDEKKELFSPIPLAASTILLK